MGYFSNGTEGRIYQERFCDRCIHDKEHNCAVWLAHLVHNEANNPDSMLHILIPRAPAPEWNGQCKMFIEDPDYVDPRQGGLFNDK